jgi:hypothetical protein
VKQNATNVRRVFVVNGGVLCSKHYVIHVITILFILWLSK